MLAANMGSAQTPAAKLALVIGVGEYGRDRAALEALGFIAPPALPNAVRDSTIVADALETKGFAVTRISNPNKRELLAATTAFAATLARAGPDAIGVFYFAGHGAQGRPALERDIDNYLIPVGASLATEVDLESEALALSRVSAALRPGRQGAVVLILDACRNFALPAASRSGLVTRGLAEARAAPGMYIAYSTSPGTTSLDSLPGQRNGPYAVALAAEIRAAQGATLEQVFIAVRNRVLAQTGNTQLPWENSSLRQIVTLGVAPVVLAPSIPSGNPARRPRSLPAVPDVALGSSALVGRWLQTAETWGGENSDCPVAIAIDSASGTLRWRQPLASQRNVYSQTISSARGAEVQAGYLLNATRARRAGKLMIWNESCQFEWAPRSGSEQTGLSFRELPGVWRLTRGRLVDSIQDGTYHPPPGGRENPMIGVLTKSYHPGCQASFSVRRVSDAIELRTNSTPTMRSFAYDVLSRNSIRLKDIANSTMTIDGDEVLWSAGMARCLYRRDN